MKSWFVRVAALLLATTGAFAAEINFSSEGLSVSDDGVTTYTGDVNVRASADTKIVIKSKTTHAENNKQVYEGDVQITLPGQLIKTDKAIVSKEKNSEILIRMESADSISTD